MVNNRQSAAEEHEQDRTTADQWPTAQPQGGGTGGNGDEPARVVAFGDADKLPSLPPGTNPNDAAAWTIASRVLLNLDETLSKN